MGSRKSRALHETQYTNGEKILSLARQLFLLRESLVRTANHATYHPDLFRALRVLVADAGRGRLGEMASKLEIVHDLPSMLSEKPKTEVETKGKRWDPHRDMRRGCTGMFFVNPCSRWLKLRGVHLDPPEPCKATDFWTYLEEENISNKSEYSARVPRKMLVEEVNNTRDVVHSSDNYATFLQGVQALGQTGPYFLEVAQDLAYETLVFGRKVVEKGAAQYRNQITAATEYDIEVPASACGRCHNLVEVDQFDCPNCKSHLLPAVRQFSIQERLSSMWHHCGILKGTEGTVVQALSALTLRQQPTREFTLAKASHSGKEMVLRRTADLKLSWSLVDEKGRREALFDLEDLPSSGLVSVFLRWHPTKVSITAGAQDGELVEVDHKGERKRINRKN